jgi:tRNA U34 5-carboxymethylaminomethyl modifying GTPase MnmE/TrmE
MVIKSTTETIVSRATSSGVAGVGVVRLSGPKAKSIALTISKKKS